MKILTKELYKSFEFHELILALENKSDKKRPFVLTNGEENCVDKKDLYTVKTDFNLTEKENELHFIMLPDNFDFEIDFLGDGEVINEETRRNDFVIQYLKNLRAITYIPEDILKYVKDKRLLALGYADKETKEKILGYIKSKYSDACNLLEKCFEISAEAETGLTIHEQIKEIAYIDSLPFLFDYGLIAKADKTDDNIYLTFDDNETIVFKNAEIIEEETDIANSRIRAMELYKKENCHEMHLLVEKRDEKLISRFYYVTYSFKDLKIQF